jgi:endonuclease/exonuclease/phosphatase family metal-dependent hydrolase
MRFRLGFLLALSACLAAGCFGGGDETTTSSAKEPEITLRVATFNLFYGGDEMVLATKDWCTDPAGCQETFDAGIDAIKQSKADIVGLQEATGNTRKVAEALGWNYNERTQIVSRFPIIDPGGADGLYVFVQPTPTSVVAVSNTHLPSSPYGPYRAQAGYTEDQVLHLEERLRLPAIQPQLEGLPPLAEAGIPVFLTGDFNSPSYLDWTEAADASRDDMPYPVEWPVSKALADAGFKDSFRVVNPDPVARPGFTWTPGGPESVKREVHDRIDWVLSAGPARAIDSSVVGEAGNSNVDISIPIWPSDHRSVVSTFKVQAAPTPEFVSVASRGMEQGQELTARYHTSKAGEALVVRPVEGGEAVAETDPSESASDGVLAASTDGLKPGEYAVELVDRNNEQVIATTSLFLYPPGTEASITTAKDVYRVGEPIEVSWKDAPGMKWDWMSAFPAGSGLGNPRGMDCAIGYCGNGNYSVYEYTHAAIEGSTTLSDSSAGGWPLKPGTYDVRLLVDDGYTRAAVSQPFEIVKP